VCFTIYHLYLFHKKNDGDDAKEDDYLDNDAEDPAPEEANEPEVNEEENEIPAYVEPQEVSAVSLMITMRHARLIM
jgi:hypothetical protein